MGVLTIADLLDETRRRLQPISPSPGREAQLLVANALGVERVRVLAHPEEPVGAAVAHALRLQVDRVVAGEALPYVLGWWEFYGRRFRIGRQVLIPRPETELLVDQALSFLRGRSGALGIDVGTGSGCIAVTLAAELSALRMIATDLSVAALRVARENARLHGVDCRVSFVAGDLALPLFTRFDLVCANLPYVPSKRLQELEVARREPRLALDGGEDGLVHVRRLLTALPELLAPGGVALVEIDETQGEASAALARELGVGLVDVHQDLSGRDRLLRIRRQAEG